jgi:hypothetical protein
MASRICGFPLLFIFKWSSNHLPFHKGSVLHHRRKADLKDCTLHKPPPLGPTGLRSRKGDMYKHNRKYVARLLRKQKKEHKTERP